MSAPRDLRAAILPIAFALAGAALVLNLLAFAFGEAPLATLVRAFEGTWGTPYGIGQVLFKATPLLFTGLAFHVSMRAGLFNIGADGQLALASLVAAFAASRLPAGTPALLALPATLAVAVAVGAGYAAIAGLMRARLGVHEVIATIMQNRIADVLVPWALAVHLGSTSLRTEAAAPGALLPRLDRALPSLTGSAASIAFPLAVVVVFAVHRWLERSRPGREMRWIGLNAEACRAEGLDVPRRLTQAMVLSGALAGSAMIATVLGYKGYYELGLGAGAGFTGIAVAMLGRGSAFGLVLAAVLFGTLEQAGLAINARVPKDAMTLLEAAVIVFVALANRLGTKTPAATGAAR